MRTSVNEKQFIARNLLVSIRNYGSGGDTAKEIERAKESEREKMETKCELLYSIFARCCVMNAKITGNHNQNGILGMDVLYEQNQRIL